MANGDDPHGGTKRGQKIFAWVAGALGTIVMTVTVLFPILGSIGVRVGDEPLTSPWSVVAGIGIGLGLFMSSAAFAQVAVGETGLGFLKRIMPGGGGGG